MKKTTEAPKSPSIRILIADDHAIIRKGIAAVLELVPDMQLVGEAENGLQAIEQDAHLQADVILMDLVMPDMDGIEAIRQIKLKRPAARILVLTTFSGEEMVFPAIKAGALGYHLKDSSPEALVEAIREVYRGEASLHPVIARKVLAEIAAPSAEPPTTEPLTPRELDVLHLVAQGCENREIAEKLVISDATVRTHLSNIMNKLHLASRTQAALYALKEGLASLEGNNQG